LYNVERKKKVISTNILLFLMGFSVDHTICKTL